MKTLYGVTIALSAFLLFSVEPMVTKELLPVLGGSSAIWITALAFFQITLLAGYAWSSWAARASSARPSTVWSHLALLALAALSLVATFAPTPGHSSPDPQLSIFFLLASHIGLPFFALSTTAPLLQAWFARRENAPTPYRLFALSNLFSLFALLTYPTLIEPNFTLSAQRRAWAAGFVVYAVAAAVLAARMLRAAPTLDSLRERSRDDAARSSLPQSRPFTPGHDDVREPATHTLASTTPARTRLLWLLLPAVASFQLAAVTAHLTENVAAMPLLWVLPLAVYLLSFVLAFELPGLYRRGLVIRLLAVLLAGLGYLLSKTGTGIPIGLVVLFFVAELLTAAWFLHAEVFALRPQDPQTSPAFYLLIAAGGALGTCAVAIVSPLLTRSNLDLPFSFALTAAAAILITWRDGWAQRLLWVTGTGLAVALLAVIHSDATRNTIFRDRNFYGSLRVKETHTPPEAVTARTLLHGTIQHGMQWFNEDFRRTPMTYYAEDSGVGLALRFCCSPDADPGVSPSARSPSTDRGANSLEPALGPPQALETRTQPRRIGVIGLGAGTVATYGKPADQIRFFEINPLVLAVAQSLFTYTRDSPATITTTPGDARLSLAAEPASSLYDVLVIDAFSGDAIPVHLLTREALALYLRHLAPGGVLAFHISNQYLDLAPVLARLAEDANTGSAQSPLLARRIDSPARPDRGEFTATWVLLSRREAFFAQPSLAAVTAPVFTRPGVALWTDNYSSLLPILHLSGGRATPDQPANVRFVR